MNIQEEKVVTARIWYYFSHYNSGLRTPTTKEQILDRAASGKAGIHVYVVAENLVGRFTELNLISPVTRQQKLYMVTEKEAMMILRSAAGHRLKRKAISNDSLISPPTGGLSTTVLRSGCRTMRVLTRSEAILSLNRVRSESIPHIEHARIYSPVLAKKKAIFNGS
ncbi:hypothetical protein NGI13_22375 [Enterobacter asburiae]|uniref:hypothetical protein n=1 Tax=Enterobacter TaxID=547 RepID=UPI0004DB4661|nr:MULTISPECIES: hypothetical protein [Enterobacter]KFA84168.1 hypothetical protein N037_22125 [Enterobacter sp. EGD-HP1]MEB8258299.1 hypothetical protein [Enterobacter asburiae]